ncbi:tetratricopeptide repeat protein, partial [Acinetobacter baumannii]
MKSKLLIIAGCLILSNSFLLSGCVKQPTSQNLVQEKSSEALRLYEEGQKYFLGKDVKQNYQKALELFQKASDQGLAEAQNDLGGMYFEGLGTTQDYQKAFKYFDSAANQKLAAAQYNLGLMYDKGLYIQKDRKKALELYELSTEQGYAKA